MRPDALHIAARDAIRSAAAARRGWHFYVTVRDADRVGWLLGPYVTRSAALPHIERARKLAEYTDSRAHFYTFGVASSAALRKPVFDGPVKGAP